MAGNTNVQQLRSYILRSRRLLEPYAVAPTAKRQVLLLNRALNAYDSHLKMVRVAARHLHTARVLVLSSKAAVEQDNLSALLTYSKALLASLPGDPLTPPRPEPPPTRPATTERRARR
jgi:hypothetical protein